jgi:hypothetical protein
MDLNLLKFVMLWTSVAESGLCPVVGFMSSRKFLDQLNNY